MHILLTHPSATPPGSIADRVLVKKRSYLWYGSPHFTQSQKKIRLPQI